ncbi:MAG TPA: diguanylate cyclase [Solirubrobacteraceae bacterium]|nr:diguanylate cyclase [Solirubrobacteraceae bacterium]
MAGRVSGLLYITAGITVPALLLPGHGAPALWVVLTEVGIALAWGFACLTIIRWERSPWWLSHLSSVAGLVLVALLMAASGGTQSHARLYLLFVVVFAAYFYPRWEALAFIVACGVVQALPLLYQSGAVQNGNLRELGIAFPTYVVAGGALIGGRAVADQLRTRASGLASERERTLSQHASLRRVATAVATSAPSHAVFTLVASEAARLLGADAAAAMRYHNDEVELVGSWGGTESRYPPGTRFALKPESEMTKVRATGQPVRTDGYPASSRHRGAVLGYQCCVCAPVWVDEKLWGAISVVAARPGALGADAEERLLEFAHLAATSIANSERQSQLARRASRDALTGLANHRSFHEHLEAEAARALRHGRPLALALVDVDFFRQINERMGHDIGDRLLLKLAHTLHALTRKGDLLARLGADEFGLLLPETDKRSAFVVLDRARQRMASAPPAGVGPVTLTAGICDIDTAGGEGSLYRLADAALQWGKTHGRDVCWIYDPSIVPVPAINPDASEVERCHALAGLQALSRAIDAKDPLTREHSERVAALAVRLAGVKRWSPERVELLESAALVHDVGKIGVPDAILLKPGKLEPAEYEVIKQHASLGAQIVEGVLSSEQVEWVRSHHERPDGQGYPNGLLASSLSEGAALLAMADAFDAMTAPRAYSKPKDIDTAVRECHELSGRQFMPDAVRALGAVYEKGLLSAA